MEALSDSSDSDSVWLKVKFRSQSEFLKLAVLFLNISLSKLVANEKFQPTLRPLVL